MKWIIEKIVKKIGYKKLIRYAYDAVRPELGKLVESTKTQLDNDVLAIVDEVVDEITDAA